VGGGGREVGWAAGVVFTGLVTVTGNQRQREVTERGEDAIEEFTT